MIEQLQLAPDAPTGLGKAMAGGGGKTARRALDYYPTPPEATRALIAAERPWLARYGTIWEPCGRGGAIARELGAAGWATIATDLVADPANAVVAQDLLTARAAPAGIAAAITNPPFAHARPMIAKLVGELRLPYVALLLKATFLNCDKSAQLARAGLAPTRRWDITWRLDFLGLNNPTMDCAWFVWDQVDRTPLHGLLDRDGPVRVAAPGLI